MCVCGKEVHSSAFALCESDEHARASVYDGVEHGSVSTGKTVFSVRLRKGEIRVVRTGKSVNRKPEQ